MEPYKIIEAANTTDLAADVNAEYPEYQAWGGVAYDGSVYLQVMVKK